MKTRTAGILAQVARRAPARSSAHEVKCFTRHRHISGSVSARDSHSGQKVTLRRTSAAQPHSRPATWRPHAAQQRRISSTSSVPQVLVNDMANQEVLVDFNGTAMRFPSFWLRDHCPCADCQHPSTHQRQLDTFTIDPEIKVVNVEPTPDGLQVTWPTDHKSLYSWSWLETHPPFTQSKAPSSPTAKSKRKASRPWTPILPTSTMPRVEYNAILSGPEGLKSFLSAIHDTGLCFIPSTPADPASTQSLIERIAHIRATHYGSFWDFTSEVNPIDTAYTNDPLPPHTDTTYFTDPAGLQLFHLLSHTSITDPSKPGTGGESTFVDGFAAAAHLYDKFPQHYHSLATCPIKSAALGAPEGSFYNTASNLQGYPVFCHSSPNPAITSPSPSTLVQIRWNNLDRDTPTTPTFPNHTALKNWYAAAREWARILESPEFLITVKLQPGEPVIFDNWRVLHGRLGFEGKRRVCGAYVGMDDFRAKCRSLGIEA
ncbi:hypothetical protein RBB50_006162 [Rhinocladiella similis]